jgi:calcineurin-like phosphoesterase family protein
MKWFSSDWHLNHIKTIELSQRPFNSVEEMNDLILFNMFKPLKRGDDFYFLGDLSWDKKLIELIYEMAAKKKIRFHWILGNHDKKIIKQFIGKIKTYNKYNTVNDMLEVKIRNEEGHHVPVILCHYPMLTWNKSHYNSYLLFGHHHKTTHGWKEILEYEKSGKKLNVNCEFHDYKPISEIEVLRVMATRPNNWDYIKKV